MASASDHIYLDLSIINNDNLGSKLHTVLNFNEVRTNPILDNPSNYYLSVVRFEVDTPGVTLPIFVPLLNVDGVNGANNEDYNETAYTITIAEVNAGGATMSNAKTLNVKWNKQDFEAKPPNNPRQGSAPTAPYVSQDIGTGYYNCYSVEWWINCINYTLNRLWSDAVDGFGNPTASAPFMTVEANTNLISLYTPSAVANNFAVQDTFANGIQYTTPVWGGGGSTPAIKYAMFFNEPLFNLFSSFNSVYYGQTFGQNTSTIFTDAPSQALALAKPFLFNYYIQPTVSPNSVPVTANGETFNVMVTDYSPVPMWNPVQSIIFSSALLPVVTSYTTAAIPYNDPSLNAATSGGNNSAITNMISDIQVALTSGTEYKPQVLYLPQGEYRMVDLNGVGPINQVSFSVSLKTKYSQILAFRLGAQCGANIKVLFRRKRFNLGNLPPYDSN